MKKILITGANSYVGTSFEKWLSQWLDKYHVDTIDTVSYTHLTLPTICSV